MQSLRTKDTGSPWQHQHNSAITEAAGFPIRHTGIKAAEAPIVKLLTAWAEYAQSHQGRFESVISEDYLLGPAWEDIGRSLRTMLNGELGRLDGGTLDRFIIDTFEGNGVDTTAL